MYQSEKTNEISIPYGMNPPQYQQLSLHSAPSAPSAPSSPSAPYMQTEPFIQPKYPQIETKSQKIRKLISEYEIDNLFSEKLDILSNFETVLIVDDSGSMNTPLANSKHATRWEELKEVVRIVIRIATIFDEDGIDINFLNRQNYENVKNLATVDYILNDTPYGLTPLNKVLEGVLFKYQNSTKPVLIVIATDGIPTNDMGYQDLKNFTNTLKNKNHSHFYVSFLACSDQDCDVGYLNKLDKKIPNIDTLDDYQSELQEVKSAQGKKFKYSFGNHIVRLLLGPLCPELDKLDEKKLRKNKCIIL